MPLPKTSPFALDLEKFIIDSVKVPYESLAQHWRDSDWKYRLVQKSIAFADGHTLITKRDIVESLPVSYFMVDTEVLIGPSVDKLEYFDTVTMALPVGPGPVTMVARLQLEQSLIAAVFGRFPPTMTALTAPPVPPPAPGQMNGGEPARHVDMHDADVVLPGEQPGGEYVDDDDRPSVNVVSKREPDGLPIFVDLYALGNPTEDTLDAVLEEVRDFLALAASVQQVDAVALKNPEMLSFIKDLGDEQDRSELRAMVEKRRRELTIPAAAAAAVHAPRRRVRSQVN